MQSKRKQRGITLVEVAATTTVLAIAVGSVVPSYSGMLSRRAVEGTASQLATDLQYVRSMGVARNQGLRIAFTAASDGSCYVIHTGARDACSCSASAAPVCTGTAEALKSVQVPASGPARLQSNVASMLFDPVRGTTTPAGTVRVHDERGQAIEHVVNVMGRTRTCSPNGSIKGYPACIERR